MHRLLRDPGSADAALRGSAASACTGGGGTVSGSPCPTAGIAGGCLVATPNPDGYYGVAYTYAPTAESAVRASCASSGFPFVSPDGGIELRDAGDGDGNPSALDAAVADQAADGSEAACAPSANVVLGTKVTIHVNWPATVNNAGCRQPGCTGNVVLWLLARYGISGSSVTGTTETCGYQTPPIPLTALGSQSEALPAGQTATLEAAFAPTVWTSIGRNPSHAPAATTGTLGGWTIGSSFTIDPTLSVYGLKPSSALSSASSPWPCSESSIPESDIADDDGDGRPGITATPSSAAGFSLPATALATTAPFGPQADALDVAMRTQLSLDGTSTSCTEIAGTASVSLLNSHVIGCRLVGGAQCAASQWDFVDSNSPVYLGPGVTVPAGTCAPSFAAAPLAGTFQSKILSTNPDGGSVTCAAVLAALP